MANLNKAFSVLDGLSFDDNCYLFEGTANPSVGSGIPAAQGSCYIRYGSTNNEIWSKFGVNDVDWKRMAITNYYANSVSGTGTLKIVTPSTNILNKTFSVRINIRSNTEENLASFVVSGQPITGNTWQYTNITKLELNNPIFNMVRFGYDGANHCILIGNTSTVWPTSTILQIEGVSYDNQSSDPDLALSSSVVASETGYTIASTKPAKIGYKKLDTYELFEDFVNALNGTVFFAKTNAAGSVVSTTPLDATNRIGYCLMTVGTTALARTAFSTAIDQFVLGGAHTIFETDVKFPNLSVSGNDYVFQIGFIDTISANADQTDGVYFEYDRATSTTNVWRIASSNNSTRTKTNTAATITAGAWNKLKFIINSGATNIDFYVNGVSVGSINIGATIPSGTTRVMGLGAFLRRATSGAADRTAIIDWIYLSQTFTSSR